MYYERLSWERYSLMVLIKPRRVLAALGWSKYSPFSIEKMTGASPYELSRTSLNCGTFLSPLGSSITIEILNSPPIVALASIDLA